MTEKLTFEKIREAVGNLKEGEEIWFAALYKEKRLFVGWGAGGDLVVDRDGGCKTETWSENQTLNWQIIHPEKKKVKLYQAVFEDKEMGYFMIGEHLFKSVEEAKQYRDDFVKLIEPAICEIEED